MRYYITMPVKNRAELVKYTLRTVLHQDIDLSDTVLHLYDDGSQDGTLKVLQRFAKRYGKQFQEVIVEAGPGNGYGNKSSRDIHEAARKKLYCHLGMVRDHLLNAAQQAGPGTWVSWDSDIWAAPTCVSTLASYSLDYVATLLLNDNGKEREGENPRGVNPLKVGRMPNCGKMMAVVPERLEGFYTPMFAFPLNAVFAVDCGGSLFVAHEKVLASSATYCDTEGKAHLAGEDVGYCLRLIKDGAEVWVDSHQRALHVMGPSWWLEQTLIDDWLPDYTNLFCPLRKV